MHNYSVLNRFTTKTKLGNWYEESQLNEHNFKEHLYNKANNMNETLNTKTKIGFSSQPRELTPIGDGLIRFGDNISLGNEKTKAVLSFNINESILGEETYAVSTSKSLNPSLRNVFSISTVNPATDDIVRYGDKIRLETFAGNKKLFLQSLPTSPMRSSKFSRLQEVSVTSNLNSNTLWIIEHNDPKLRFDAIGGQIKTGETVLIKHCATGQWLASDDVSYINDFGKEFEVYCKSWISNNKTQNLFGEKIGHISSENPLRDQDERNEWRLFKGRE